MSTERVKVTVTTSYLLVTGKREKEHFDFLFNLNETWDHNIHVVQQRAFIQCDGHPSNLPSF